MRRTSKQQLKESIRSLKLPTDATVMIHSSLIKFGIVEGGAKGALDVIFDVLGPDATIVMPAFSFNFPEVGVWENLNTKSKMGALTEAFRKHPGVYRTNHPFHSVCVLGKHQDKFKACDCISSFGTGSPFEVLIDIDAYNIGLGTEFIGGFTFLHHIEEVLKVPYRMTKKFPGVVRDETSVEIDKTYEMYVRIITDEYEYNNDWNRVFSDLDSTCEILNNKLHGANIYCCNIRKLSNEFKKMILSNPFYPSMLVKKERIR
jgi:aminoglycoside 3-N-acetyltransferase